MRCHKLISIDKEILRHITQSSKKNNFNFSAWAEKRYCEEVMDSEAWYDLQIKELEQQISNFNKLKLEVKANNKKFLDNLNNTQIAELQVTVELTKKNPERIQGRYNLWCKTFGIIGYPLYLYLIENWRNKK